MHHRPQRGTEDNQIPKRTILPGLLTTLAAVVLTCALAFSFTAKRVESARKHTRGGDE